MTTKLYYIDQKMHTFQAKVLVCKEVNGHFEALLDQTAFFPEGGGQAADTGYLNEIRVTDVQESDEEIWHTVDQPIQEGTQVTGKLDFEQRLERMQQHSGEHIISGIVCSTFGYRNVGFHLNDEICTMDFNGVIEKEKLNWLEQKANEIVFANLPVEIAYPSKEELEHLEYRSKIEIDGQVRIVTIPGCDSCACCAPHVEYTGEIGLIKFIGSQNYKGGVRLTMVCGRRALSDYQAKDHASKAISAMLSAKEEQIAEAVERLKKENEQLKSKLVNQQKELVLFKAQQMEVHPYMYQFEEGLDPNSGRELMNALLAKGASVCLVLTGDEQSGYRYVLGSKEEDVRDIGKALNEACQGRGGGKPEMVQGTLQASKEMIIEYLKKESAFS